jgi:hypothetical protein
MEMIDKWYIPEADREIADKRWRSVLGPSDFVRRNAKPMKYPGGMKMHDWHIFVKYLAQFVLNGILPDDHFEVVCELFECIGKLSSQEFEIGELDLLDERLLAALVAYQDIVPATEHTTIVHVLVHFVETLRDFGPCYSYWMYSVERLLCDLSRLVKDTSSPEREILNNYSERIAVRYLQTEYQSELLSLENTHSGRQLLNRFGLTRGVNPTGQLVVATVYPEVGRNKKKIRLVPLGNGLWNLIVNYSSHSDELKSASEVTQLWKIERCCQVNGVSRGTATSKPHLSGFLLKDGEVRRHLLSTSVPGTESEFFGQVQCFLLAVCTEKTLRLASVKIYHAQHKIIPNCSTMGLVNTTEHYEDMVIDANLIGAMKVFRPSNMPQFPRANGFKLILGVPDRAGRVDSKAWT